MLSASKLVEIVDRLNERAGSIREGAYVALMYWAHDWTAVIHLLDLRGRGPEPEAALSMLDRMLTDYERRDANVAKTIGIAANA